MYFEVDNILKRDTLAKAEAVEIILFFKQNFVFLFTQKWVFYSVFCFP